MANSPHQDRRERGRRLAEARTRAKLSQDDLAELAGFRKREEISRLETGKIGISYKNALKLVPHLKGEVEVDDLAFVASPSMLYLVRAIAEKLEIPLHPPIPVAEDESEDGLHDHLSELDRLATTEDQAEDSAQPREGTGRS